MLRAINMRLNKIVNRICSRAQKGFNNQRYTEEFLINVWETINYCKSKNIDAAIMAIDMAKAFDTLSNSFLDRVYEFFGFGQNITKWLKLLGTNRAANIILEDGCLSRLFKLERGHPQGDNISPITFNFCTQILIFKIELDPLIANIPRDPTPVHANYLQLDNNNERNFFMYESGCETDKNEGLADDCTTITMMDLDSLTK